MRKAYSPFIISIVYLIHNGEKISLINLIKNTRLTQDNIKNKISILYNKYLLKSITRKEFEELFILLDKDANQHLLEEIIEDAIQRDQFKDHVLYSKSSLSQERVQVDTVKKRRKYQWMAYAAAFLFLITTGYVYYQNQNSWKVVETGFMETELVTLPDGSTVKLNASSQLRWKKGLKDPIREVYFEGEGFFDVAHQEGRKFIVRSKDIEVNVIGTKFNVESRNTMTKVFLAEGKVEIEGEDIPKIKMEPGDLIKYDESKNRIQQIKNRTKENEVSWVDGVFTFTDLTGFEILEKMQAIYGKEFIIEDSTGLEQIIVVQGLPYADWDFTKEALALTLQIKLTESISDRIVVRKK